MASYLKLLMEDTLYDLLSTRVRKKTNPSVVVKGTPADRFIQLMNHKEWGPGVKDFVKRNPELSLPQLMLQVRLKPDLVIWMKNGTFRGEARNKPPSRQEIHDLNYHKDMMKKRMSLMIDKPKGGEDETQEKEG